MQTPIPLDGIKDEFPPEVLELLKTHRVVAIGEMHGSAEIPAFFTRVATQLSTQGTRLCVGLELFARNQAGLDAYVETLDEKVLFSMPHFANPSDDGKASTAMVEMIRALALIPEIEFCAFDADSTTWITQDDQGRDTAMAENVSKFVNRNPDARVLILCGSVHSSTEIGAFFDPNFRPMMYELCHQDRAAIKPREVYSILVDFEGGQTWTQSSCDSKPPMTWVARESPFPTLVDLQSYFLPFVEEKFHGHDALVFIRTLSASPPFAVEL